MADILRRALLGAVLLSALLGMAVHYGAVGPRHDEVMAGQAMLSVAEPPVGESVYVWGEVAGHPDAGTTRVDAGARTVTVTRRLAAPPGTVVQVAGTVGPGWTVAPERVVVSSGDRTYLYGVSLVGLAVAAVAFHRRWRFDPEHLAFVPRGDRGA